MEFVQPGFFAGIVALGFRHGFDWDHIAAILDIVGTTSAQKRGSFLQQQWRAILLSFPYALGHGLVCLILGFLALKTRTLLPAWIDPIMESIVGMTLVFLGFWIIYGALKPHIHKETGTLATSGIAFGRKFRNYGPRTIFGIGALHGIGAETGTQALLLGAMGSSGGSSKGLAILCSFVVGLVLANILVSMVAASGFVASAYARRCYVFSAVITGAFSICVGLYFVFGMAGMLPSI